MKRLIAVLASVGLAAAVALGTADLIWNKGHDAARVTQADLIWNGASPAAAP